MTPLRGSSLHGRTAALALALVAAFAAPGARAQGKAVYDQACGVCHNAGIVGAPKLGDAKAWEPRIPRRHQHRQLPQKPRAPGPAAG